MKEMRFDKKHIERERERKESAFTSDQHNNNNNNNDKNIVQVNVLECMCE